MSSHSLTRRVLCSQVLAGAAVFLTGPDAGAAVNARIVAQQHHDLLDAGVANLRPLKETFRTGEPTAFLFDLSSDGMEKSEGKILVYIDDGAKVEARKLFSFVAAGASLSFKNPQRITQGPAATKPGQKTLVVATEDNAASAQIIVV